MVMAEEVNELTIAGSPICPLVVVPLVKTARRVTVHLEGTTVGEIAAEVVNELNVPRITCFTPRAETLDCTVAMSAFTAAI